MHFYPIERQETLTRLKAAQQASLVLWFTQWSQKTLRALRLVADIVRKNSAEIDQKPRQYRQARFLQIFQLLCDDLALHSWSKTASKWIEMSMDMSESSKASTPQSRVSDTQQQETFGFAPNTTLVKMGLAPRTDPLGWSPGSPCVNRIRCLSPAHISKSASKLRLNH